MYTKTTKDQGEAFEVTFDPDACSTTVTSEREGEVVLITYGGHNWYSVVLGGDRPNNATGGPTIEDAIKIAVIIIRQSREHVMTAKEACEQMQAYIKGERD